ncbi:DMT family transporter [Corynebacterium sp. TAE3-ERU12]|uniref:DMT family transporter n=1 Tax=Corynebacterium sp. TAE3-ERU12 TaxID=2849491 RepID=UPI001C46EC3F|nr:DMT family transporter [Corynebacterium sp. TAE3-ERU12]
MHNPLIAVTLGLAAALSIAFGTVIRHQLADTVPDESGTFSGVIDVISRPRWWAGLGLALAGYGLQIAALAFGSLLLVQPLLVMKLMFTLPLSAHINGRRISVEEGFWATVLTVSVGVLVILGRPLPGASQPPLKIWIPALVVGAVVFFFMQRSADRMGNGERTPKALTLGLATGLLYGYVAVLSKAVIDVGVHEGTVALLISWQLWLLIALALIGAGVQQAAFNAGPLRTSLPAMSCGEPIIAFMLGYIVLGERFQVDGSGWYWLLLALIGMIVSTVYLSSDRTVKN